MLATLSMLVLPALAMAKGAAPHKRTTEGALPYEISEFTETPGDFGRTDYSFIITANPNYGYPGFQASCQGYEVYEGYADCVVEPSDIEVKSSLDHSEAPWTSSIKVRFPTGEKLEEIKNFQTPVSHLPPSWNGTLTPVGSA